MGKSSAACSSTRPPLPRANPGPSSGSWPSTLASAPLAAAVPPYERLGFVRDRERDVEVALGLNLIHYRLDLDTSASLLA
jgi:hypothetical protein